MRKYETLLLLSPELAGEARQDILTNLRAVVEREGGIPVALEDWGSRELAYPVKKLTRGYYIRLEYAGPSNLVAELERIIRLNEGILKFLTVKLDDEFDPNAPREEAPAEEEALAETPADDEGPQAPQASEDEPVA